MKRLALLFTMLVAMLAVSVVSAPSARAGLFGGSKSTPSPSPSPSALPTASPEPPSVAIPRLQARLKKNPSDQNTMVELAGEFLQISRPDLTAQLTQHLLQMGDKNAQVYYLDGYAMNALGRSDQAISDLEAAEDLDPSNTAVLGQLADLYLRANRFSDAERIANRAMVLDKGDEASYQMMGSVYAAEQKYDQARATFEAAAAKSPKDSQPLYQIAQTYAAQDNIPMALQSIDRAIAVDPKDVQNLVFKADLYARQHEDTKAANAYDDAIVAAPDDQSKVQIVIRKASYFASEKKNDKADAVFLQGIAQYPKVPAIYVGYGDLLATEKHLDKAKQQWQMALSLDGSDVEALTRLSQVSLQQQRFTDAIGYLKKLTEIQPDPTAFALLGQAYSYQHDYAKSKDACSKSFQLARAPQTLACIAGADYELKNYKEAAQIFAVLDSNAKGYLDHNPELLFVAAKSYQQVNQRDKAANAYKRLLPMMKKGTKEYAQVQSTIADLSRPEPHAKKTP